VGTAFLKIVAGSRTGTNVPLEVEAPLVMGRTRGDLVLDDPMISGRHAQVHWRDGSWWLQDLKSTNGTMVDGRLVREVQLRPGAEITVGNTRMVLFVTEEPESATARPNGFNQSHVELAWLLDEELVSVDQAAARGDNVADVIGQDLRLPPAVNAVLEVVAGQDVGKVFRFTRGNVTIGRRMGEIPLSDPEVSRRHAVIEMFGREMIFLRDLGSTNGTYHNGRRVSVSGLGAGDTVGVGKSVMKLKVSS